MNKKETVILIPSYEPDRYLINTVNELFNEGFNILVVNDGSSNEYDEIFNEILPLVKYLKFEKNRGKGAALKEGYKNILSIFPNAKYVITADGDGQHSTKDIVRVNNLLNKKDELVLAVRIFDKSVPHRSKVGNNWSKFNRGLLTKQYVEDDQCGLRGFPVRYLDELVKIKGNRYDYEINQLTSFQLRQYQIYTLPIEVIYLDNNSRSHFSQFKDTMRIQSKIIYQGLPALFCLSLLIAGLILLYHFGYSFYHLSILGGYLGVGLIYLTITSVIQPSKNPKKRTLKELLFTTIKMTLVFGLMYLFSNVFKLTYYASIPLLVVLACSMNLIIPYIFKKKAIRN